MAVVIEHGGHGGSAAAPVAQKVLARYFERLVPEPQQLAAAGRQAGSSESTRAAD